MTRKQAFERRYKGNASAVLSSIARVGAAGRSGDPAKIEAERDRHRRLMASLP
jgi:hypothetical protein